MNKVMLIGWLVNQPEIKVNADGELRCSVDLAVEREGNVPDVVTLIASGKLAEDVAEFNSGEQIGITGSIKTKLCKNNLQQTQKVTEVEVEKVDLKKTQESPLNDEFLPSIIAHSKDK